MTVLWCCGDDPLLQVLHVQVHNNGGYWTAHGYSERLLVNFPSKSEVHYLQWKCQQFHDVVYIQAGSLLSVLSFSSLFLMISHACFFIVLVNNDTTLYDTKDSPSSTLIFVISFPVPVNLLHAVLFFQQVVVICHPTPGIPFILLSVCNRQLV